MKFKQIVSLALAGIFATALLTACSPEKTPTSASSSESSVAQPTTTTAVESTPVVNVNNYAAGDTLKLGAYNWRVLEVQGDKALIITESVVALRPYNSKFEPLTWETCELRSYLNSDFYDSFTPDDKAKIVETTISNPDNPTYKTPGGNATSDKIFLLSVEEVKKYFKDDNDRVAKGIGEDMFGYSEYYNYLKDYAKKGEGLKNSFWWWTRTQGSTKNTAAYVGRDGIVDENGYVDTRTPSGVRPALWLSLS
ncbi:MAG: DUF6273 domain-containing protein [Oscillospiraceae bacterium]|jgi:hypothetical protein|nr:DUF6273 domain-containing protein [Oscillospiraceae bacterium]